MELHEVLGILLVIGLPCLIFWRLGWFKNQYGDAKLDFGPEKPKKLWSFDGLLYVLWNWKSYTAKAVWIGAIPFIWYYEGFGAAFSWFAFGGALVLLGRFWELFKR